jgi:hypothetical protein
MLQSGRQPSGILKMDDSGGGKGPKKRVSFAGDRGGGGGGGDQAWDRMNTHDTVLVEQEVMG